MTCNGCYNAEFAKLLKSEFMYNNIRTTIFMMSWPIVMSRMCLNNIKMTNVSRKD